MKRWYALLPLLTLSLVMTCSDVLHNYDEQNRSLCCLCACHAHDERRCSGLCVGLQHSHMVIDEYTMDSCTLECRKENVAQ